MLTLILQLWYRVQCEHYTAYTSRSTGFTLCLLFTVYCILYTVHCILYTAEGVSPELIYGMGGVFHTQCTSRNLHCTMNIEKCKAHSAQTTVNSVQFTVFNVQSRV